jgi:asparagine synthetase B (glutamine-hydrolysing)
VVGAYIKNVCAQDLRLVKEVILESRIRGLHATGVSFLKAGRIQTVIQPVSALEFMRSFDLNSCVDGDDLVLVAHCRYSTSDLEYNQPIYSSEVSIVHNGVITQELPENWESKYGYTTVGKNDTELLLRSIEANKNPLIEWKDASISAVELHRDKKIRFYRNGKRPLYVSSLPNGVIVTSTKNIMDRASGGTLDASEASKDTIYEYCGSLTKNEFDIDTVDLQHVR